MIAQDDLSSEEIGESVSCHNGCEAVLEVARDSHSDDCIHNGRLVSVICTGCDAVLITRCDECDKLAAGPTLWIGRRDGKVVHILCNDCHEIAHHAK